MLWNCGAIAAILPLTPQPHPPFAIAPLAPPPRSSCMPMKHKHQRRCASVAMGGASIASSIAPTESDTDECSSGNGDEGRAQHCPHSARSSHPSAPASPSPLQAGDDWSFNDGTSLSPLPSDPSFLHDPYLQAWHSLSEEEEAAYLHSDDYKHFDSLLVEGKLVLRECDLSSMQRWKVTCTHQTRRWRSRDWWAWTLCVRLSDAGCLCLSSLCSLWDSSSREAPMCIRCASMASICKWQISCACNT